MVITFLYEDQLGALFCVFCSPAICSAVRLFLLQSGYLLYSGLAVCYVVGLTAFWLSIVHSPGYLFCSQAICSALGLFVLQPGCLVCSWAICSAIGLSVLQSGYLFCSRAICSAVGLVIKGVLFRGCFVCFLEYGCEGSAHLCQD